MKVFISYGDFSDQVTALRLQALGAVNGLTVEFLVRIGEDPLKV